MPSVMNTQSKRHPIQERKERRLHQLKNQIVELGLEQNVIDLELFGKTIILEPEPIEFFDELRSEIMRCAEEDRQLGRTHDPVPDNG